MSSLPSVTEETGEIETATMFAPYPVTPDVDVLPAYLPVPGMGVLASNSFLVRGSEPLLVDAGPGGTADGFRTALESLIDPAGLRWLWLTHTDPDHIGALSWLLEAAPDMRVITTYLAVGKMSMIAPLPMDRLYWANPGDVVDIGDRVLTAYKPASYDAPETTGFYDAVSDALFTADSFGAVITAPTAHASDVSSGDLEEGMMLWSTIDAPWLARIDRGAFEHALAKTAGFGAQHVLSAHLPPASGVVDTLLSWMRRVPDADPWVGPDQQALDAILSHVQQEVPA